MFQAVNPILSWKYLEILEKHILSSILVEFSSVSIHFISEELVKFFKFFRRLIKKKKIQSFFLLAFFQEYGNSMFIYVELSNIHLQK